QKKNKKNQSIWKTIIEKVNSVGTVQRSVTEVKDIWSNMCRNRKMRFAEHRRETQKTGGGPPPAPLSQTVADIVDLYKGCSSFVGVSGGLETPISKQTVVLFYNSNIMVKKNDIYCNPTTPPPPSPNPTHHFNSLIFQKKYSISARKHIKIDYITTGRNLVQAPYIGLNIVEVPSAEDFYQAQRLNSPETGCSNATLPEMTAETASVTVTETINKSKKDKNKPKRKNAEDVYELQCVVLERELQKNNLQIELFELLLKKAKREDRELSVAELFPSLS
ncbi:uncharacterized protein LOC111099434, partial [Crassostrea virginica]